VSTLVVDHLQVSYGPVRALEDFSIAIPQGGFTVLLGESGCGKSTALNAIAGLTQADRGRIRIGDKVVFEADGHRLVAMPANKRDIGMVFQSYALWPHLTVLENVMYPLRRRGVAEDEAKRKAHEVLGIVRCDGLVQRHPGELSGGQQQRVALARALAGKPKLLLFDEPLSNLDASLRRGLRDELARLHADIGFTAIYVTHDQSEALALGTELAVMDRGRIVQLDRPANVFERPRTEFVAKFFGANVLHGRVFARAGQSARVQTALGELISEHVESDGEVSIAFPPQAVALEACPEGALAVTAIMYLGSHRELRLQGEGCDMLAIQPCSAPPLALHSRVHVRIDPVSVHTFPRVASGSRI
jgi:iron(III) transport system ATP-binding protein